MSKKIIPGEIVISINAECEGNLFLYKEPFDSAATYLLPLKPYEHCFVLDRKENSRYKRLQIKTASGIIGWIHPSSVKRI